MTPDKTLTPSDNELDAILCNQWPAFASQATLVRIWVRQAMRDAVAVFGDATPQPTQAQAGAVQLEYARLQAISLDYSDVEDECIGFRDGWRSAEKHHGIKGGQP